MLSKYNRKIENYEKNYNSDINDDNYIGNKSNKSKPYSKSRFNFSNESKLSLDKSKSVERSWENFPILQ